MQRRHPVRRMRALRGERSRTRQARMLTLTRRLERRAKLAAR